MSRLQEPIDGTRGCREKGVSGDKGDASQLLAALYAGNRPVVGNLREARNDWPQQASGAASVHDHSGGCKSFRTAAFAAYSRATGLLRRVNEGQDAAARASRGLGQLNREAPKGGQCVTQMPGGPATPAGWLRVTCRRSSIAESAFSEDCVAQATLRLMDALGSREAP